MLTRQAKPKNVTGPTGAASAVDEAALMHAARCDPSYFAPIYRHYVPFLYAYCLRRAGSPQDAEDLTSQVITRALQGLRTYRGGSVAAWLFRIAHNAVIDHYHARGPDCDTWGEHVGQFPDPQLPLIERIIREEQNARLHGVIAQLPADDRELLALKFDADLNAQEIGTVLGKRPEAVRVQLCRVMKRLRALCPEDLC